MDAASAFRKTLAGGTADEGKSVLAPVGKLRHFEKLSPYQENWYFKQQPQPSAKKTRQAFRLTGNKEETVFL